jgi:hypothetical protein
MFMLFQCKGRSMWGGFCLLRKRFAHAKRTAKFSSGNDATLSNTQHSNSIGEVTSTAIGVACCAFGDAKQHGRLCDCKREMFGVV